MVPSLAPSPTRRPGTSSVPPGLRGRRRGAAAAWDPDPVLVSPSGGILISQLGLLGLPDTDSKLLARRGPPHFTPGRGVFLTARGCVEPSALYVNKVVVLLAASWALEPCQEGQGGCGAARARVPVPLTHSGGPAAASGPGLRGAGGRAAASPEEMTVMGEQAEGDRRSGQPAARGLGDDWTRVLPSERSQSPTSQCGQRGGWGTWQNMVGPEPAPSAEPRQRRAPTSGRGGRHRRGGAGWVGGMEGDPHWCSGNTHRPAPWASSKGFLIWTCVCKDQEGFLGEVTFRLLQECGCPPTMGQRACRAGDAMGRVSFGDRKQGGEWLLPRDAGPACPQLRPRQGSPVFRMAWGCVAAAGEWH